MRLIDADKLIRTVSWFTLRDGKEIERHYVEEKRIDEAPTVDTEPVRHGWWIFNPKDAIEMMFTLPKCSVCGAESPNGGNYCPNCGAKMDLDEVEE